MIFEPINFLLSQINQHFKNGLGFVEDPVVVSNLINIDGSIPLSLENKIIMTLVNLESDMNFKNRNLQNRIENLNDENLAVFNISLLFTANYQASNYLQALKMISFLNKYLQEHILFTKETSFNLPPGIEKIILSNVNYNLEELNNLWSMHGSNYMPSLVYRLKVV